jgi:hypothetical protein
MPSRAQPKRRPAIRAENSDTAAANMHSATIRQRLRDVQGGALITSLAVPAGHVHHDPFYVLESTLDHR